MALQPSLRFLQVGGDSSAPYTLEASNMHYYKAHCLVGSLALPRLCLSFLREDRKVCHCCRADQYVHHVLIRSVENNLKPMISSGGKYEGKVKIIIRLHPRMLIYFPAEATKF